MSAALSQGPLRVVIAGGGVAGLEALLALADLAEDRLEVALVDPAIDFVYKPMAVAEPFAAGEAERRALRPAVEELGGRFVPQALAAVRPAERHAELADASALAYDALLVAVGARARPAFRRAVTFGSEGGARELTDMVADLGRGTARRVAFVVPPRVAWSLPLYELALLTERRAREAGASDVSCVVVTPERRPLALFGERASRAVGDLLARRGIEVITGARAREIEDGRLVLDPGHRPLRADHVVALPTLDGPHLPGLPRDREGFIPIDDRCRVRDVERIWAAGDGTTFPIKQGGLAAQQADVAAEQIAALAGVEVRPRPFEPVLRGMLLTGEDSVYAHRDLRRGPTSGDASEDCLWWPPHKIGGRYLPAWLAHAQARSDLEPPRRPLDVEVALPREWHELPMALDPQGPLT
jgi:sulfide:quinone oxidoreductase